MAFIKEESEDIRIEEVFSIKQEDTEEQTDLVLKEENQDLNEMEQTDQCEKPHDVSVKIKNLNRMREFTPERGHSPASSVERASLNKEPSKGT
ncbi:hypothetical protein QQF64_034125 [Cirrhinus molitorella]|uniref:Uncharacterized protein n=1 Tax=Cirrhinus molitorella TaxID=172907 RepID=A0ABR3MVX1_9TELE